MIVFLGVISLILLLFKEFEPEQRRKLVNWNNFGRNFGNIGEDEETKFRTSNLNRGTGTLNKALSVPPTQRPLGEETTFSGKENDGGPTLERSESAPLSGCQIEEKFEPPQIDGFKHSADCPGCKKNPEKAPWAWHCYVVDAENEVSNNDA